MRTSEQSTSSPLDNLSIAAPCHANWNEMSGDDRARFCQLCKKHVYNISAMSRADAEALIKEKEGKLCLRFARRADGTVVADNCPVGLRAIRNRVCWIAASIAAAFIGGTALASSSSSTGSGARRASLKEWFFPPKVPPHCFTMGAPPPMPRCAGTPPASVYIGTPSVVNPVTANSSSPANSDAKAENGSANSEN